MKLVNVSTMIFCAVVATACGRIEADTTITAEPEYTTSHSYQLSRNGCSTGKHSFNWKSDMCRALQDSSLNNWCVVDMRQDLFHRECPGQSFIPY